MQGRSFSAFRASGVQQNQRLKNHRALFLLLLLLSFCRSTTAVVDYGRCVVQLILYDTDLSFGVDAQEFARLATSWGACVVDTVTNGDATDIMIAATFDELACVCPDNVSFNTCCNDENDEERPAVLARPAGQTDPYAALVCDAIDALVKQTCQEQPVPEEEDNDSNSEVPEDEGEEENVFERPTEEAPIPTAAPAFATVTNTGNNDDGEGEDNEESGTEDTGDTEAEEEAVTEESDNHDNSNVLVPVLQDETTTVQAGDDSSSGTTPTWIWSIIGVIGFCGVVLWVVLVVVACRQRQERRSQFVEHAHPLEEHRTDRTKKEKDENGFPYLPQDDTEDVQSSSSSGSGRSSSPHITTTTLEIASSPSLTQQDQLTEFDRDSSSVLSSIPNEGEEDGLFIPALDPLKMGNHGEHDDREMEYYVDETSDEEAQGDHPYQHNGETKEDGYDGQASLSTWMRDWLSVSSTSESDASVTSTSTDDHQSYSSSSLYQTDATGETPLVSNTIASQPHLLPILNRRNRRDRLRPPRRQRCSRSNNCNITGFNYDSPPSDDDDVLTVNDTKFQIPDLV